MIQVDRDLYHLSSYIELEKPEQKEDSDFISKSTMDIIEKNQPKREDKKEDFLKRIRKYLLMRAPYDYYYVGKETIKNSTK